MSFQWEYERCLITSSLQFTLEFGSDSHCSKSRTQSEKDERETFHIPKTRILFLLFIVKMPDPLPHLTPPSTSNPPHRFDHTVGDRVGVNDCHYVGGTDNINPVLIQFLLLFSMLDPVQRPDGPPQSIHTACGRQHLRVCLRFRRLYSQLAGYP